MIKRTARILSAAICAAVLLLPVLSSCGGEPSDAGTAALSETGEPAPAAVSIAGYTIIRPDSGEDPEFAMRIHKALGGLEAGYGLKTDWKKSDDVLPAEAKEILVGHTNRAESEELYLGLRTYDYRIKYFPESGRIAVAGGSEDALSRAVNAFLEQITDGTVSAALSVEVCYGEYRLTKLTLDGRDVSEYTVVTGARPDNDLRTAADLLVRAIEDACGRKLTVTDSADGAAIILQKGDAFSLSSDGGVITVTAPGGGIVRAARAVGEMIAPGDAAGELSSVLSGKTLDLETPAAAAAPAEFGELPVALADQKNACAAVYDIAPALSGGEAVLKYTFAPTSSLGFSVDKTYGNRIDEAKFIYSPDHGCTLIGFTSSSGFVGLAEYPSGKKIFETKLSGYGPHSIDYIPGGLLALALSGNGNEEKAFIRVYNIETGDYCEAKLTGAHSVVWDREREILFALGSGEVKAYDVSGGARLGMTEQKYYAASGSYGGHDLSPYAGDNSLLLVSGSGPFVYSKLSGTASTALPSGWGTSAKSIKCFCSIEYQGKLLLFRTVATNVYASHDTDRFRVFTVEGKTSTGSVEIVFPDRAFYKARVIG